LLTHYQVLLRDQLLELEQDPVLVQDPVWP
jgi:hypothetical protein